MHTTVAIAGQLGTVKSLLWGFTAFVADPLSDRYDRRLPLLFGLFFSAFGLFRRDGP